MFGNRLTEQHKELFLSFVKLQSSVSQVAIFSLHSVRSPSTSYASNHIQIETGLKTGAWCSLKTFAKHSKKHTVEDLYPKLILNLNKHS